MGGEETTEGCNLTPGAFRTGCGSCTDGKGSYHQHNSRSIGGDMRESSAEEGVMGLGVPWGVVPCGVCDALVTTNGLYFTPDVVYWAAFG